MVQLMRSLGEKTAVKLEADNCLEDQLSPPLHKRSKLDSSNPQRPDGDGGVMYNDSKNPLEEPSPLGLRLKKSPSFLDLIQMKLSQQNTSTSTAMLSKKKTTTTITNTTTTSSSASVADKLKASNFPASLLKIGTWEYKSRYEGDLVAKCYFAKHKLVWEVLDGGLKNKVEIQWSDIVAIKATFSSEGPETLDVVLARQPLFFRETNPQPRKHTLWQATSDFTGGQASIHRQHFLQCQHGLMGKHFEKLIQCDPRLNFLSRQQEILLESPYFEQRVPAFGDLNESSEGLDPKPEDRSAVFALQDAGPPSGALSSSLNIECQGFMCRTPENILQETPSPSFEIRSSRTDEQKLPNHWDQIKVHGIHSSMSMSDLVNHIGHCISEQMTSGNPALSGGEIKSDDILEEITQYLLGDAQHASALDEQSLMSRANSLCCLLQKDPGTVRDLQAKSHSHLIADSDGRTEVRNSTTGSASQRKSVEGFPAPASQSNNISSCKQAPAMSRKDSVGDLLLNLPRIASLPRFLFNI